VSPVSDPLVARAHPFTGPSVTLAVTLLAFLLPAPGGPVILYGVVVLAALLTGAPSALWHGALICLPLWFFLFLLHGALGGEPTWAIGPVALSREGSSLALAQAGRLGAIATATLAMYRGFHAPRFIDAAAQRGWPFQFSYLLVATIMAVPRFVSQVRLIREAQRARGLRVSGMVGRGKGLKALALPLMFGALAEVEERALALETRSIRSTAKRTPLHTVEDRFADRGARWGAWLAVALAAWWRFAA